MLNHLRSLSKLDSILTIIFTQQSQHFVKKNLAYLVHFATTAKNLEVIGVPSLNIMFLWTTEGIIVWLQLVYLEV